MYPQPLGPGPILNFRPEFYALVAQRLENDLGEEQWTFIEGCQRDWNQLPPPDGPLTVGIDGGYIRGRNKEGHFEVVAGKSLLAFRREAGEAEELSGKCFAFVQTYDEKPERRLFEVLRSQGLTMNQQVEFLSDGGEDVRQVQLYLNPEAEHLLDWFHITMRLTVLNQIGKGLPEKIGEGEDECELRPDVLKDLESLKWYLWHGNVLPGVEEVRRPGNGSRGSGFRNQRRGSPEIAEAHRGTAHLRETQPAVLPQLRRALSQRGTDRVRLRGIGGESGGEQTNGEAPTNAVDATRRAPAVTDPHEGAQ